MPIHKASKLESLNIPIILTKFFASTAYHKGSSFSKCDSHIFQQCRKFDILLAPHHPIEEKDQQLILPMLQLFALALPQFFALLEELCNAVVEPSIIVETFMSFCKCWPCYHMQTFLTRGILSTTILNASVHKKERVIISQSRDKIGHHFKNDTQKRIRGLMKQKDRVTKTKSKKPSLFQNPINHVH